MRQIEFNRKSFASNFTLFLPRWTAHQELRKLKFTSTPVASFWTHASKTRARIFKYKSKESFLVTVAIKSRGGCCLLNDFLSQQTNFLLKWNGSLHCNTWSHVGGPQSSDRNMPINVEWNERGQEQSRWSAYIMLSFSTDKGRTTIPKSTITSL